MTSVGLNVRESEARSQQTRAPFHINERENANDFEQEAIMRRRGRASLLLVAARFFFFIYLSSLRSSTHYQDGRRFDRLAGEHKTTQEMLFVHWLRFHCSVRSRPAPVLLSPSTGD